MEHIKNIAKELVVKQKVGKESSYYINTTDCPICYAQDKDGKDIRLLIDRYLISHSLTETKNYCHEFNINVTNRAVEIHLEKHSQYIVDAKKQIEKMAERVALARLDKIEQEVIDADEVIQDIITIGGQKIRTEEIKVDSKLLLGAIKEQGTRKKMGSLQQMITELDKGRFVVGEVLEEEVKEEKILNIPED